MKRDQKILEYITLTIATIILDVGVYFFKFPNNFSFGGVTGLAVVLSQVTALRASTLNFVINMVLLVFGFLFLGRGFGIKTVYVSVLSSLGLSLLDVFCPMQGPLTSQPVLELIYAIVLIVMMIFNSSPKVLEKRAVMKEKFRNKKNTAKEAA